METGKQTRVSAWICRTAAGWKWNVIGKYMKNKENKTKNM